MSNVTYLRKVQRVIPVVQTDLVPHLIEKGVLNEQQVLDLSYLDSQLREQRKFISRLTIGVTILIILQFFAICQPPI